MNQEPLHGLEWLAGLLVVAVFIVALANAPTSLSGTPLLASASTPTNNTNNNWCGTPTSQASSGSVDEQCKPGCEYQVDLATGGTPQVIVIKSPAPGATATPQLQAQLPPGQVTYITAAGQPGGQSVQTCAATGKDAAGNPTYSSLGSLNGNAGVTYTENGITAIGNGISSLFEGSSAPTPTLPNTSALPSSYPFFSGSAPYTIPPGYGFEMPANTVPADYLDIDNPGNGFAPQQTVSGTGQYGGAYQYVPPTPTYQGGPFAGDPAYFDYTGPTAPTQVTTVTPGAQTTITPSQITSEVPGNTLTYGDGPNVVNPYAVPSQVTDVGSGLTYANQTFTPPASTLAPVEPAAETLCPDLPTGLPGGCQILEKPLPSQPSTPIPGSYIEDGVAKPPFQSVSIPAGAGL